MACTWRQTGFWQDDKTLWEHALACDPSSVKAHYLFGRALSETDESGAVAQYRQALELGPHERNIYNAVRAQAHDRLAEIAARNGDDADAIAHYQQVLELEPNFVTAHMNLGGLLVKQGKYDEAMRHFQRTVELRPDGAIGYCNMALTLSRQGKNDEAIVNFRKALAIESPPGHCPQRARHPACRTGRRAGSGGRCRGSGHALPPGVGDRPELRAREAGPAAVESITARRLDTVTARPTPPARRKRSCRSDRS